MWILTFLPETAIHILLTVSILGLLAGFVFGFIALVNKYKLPIQIISLLLFTFALYLEGGLADYKEWQLKVKEMEAKVAQMEADAAKKNVEIQEKVVEKTKVIHEKGRNIIQYIDREVVKKEEVIKYIEQCPVPKEIIDIHNQAATPAGEKQ